MSLEGKWECIKTENLEEFLKKKKINFVQRKLAKLSNPTQIIEKTGDKKWKIKLIINSLIQPEFEATEGEEFIDNPPIGESTRCILRSDPNDPNKLIQEAKNIDNSNDLTIITREIIGDQLRLKFEYQGVTCVRFFTRSSK